MATICAGKYPVIFLSHMDLSKQKNITTKETKTTDTLKFSSLLKLPIIHATPNKSIKQLKRTNSFEKTKKY